MSFEQVALDCLQRQMVAITGRLASMKRPDAIALIEHAGGRYAKIVTSDTTILVVGQEGWPLRSDGRLTQHLERAEELKQQGVALDVLSESEFFGRLGLGDREDGIRRLYTSEQLGRILRIPSAEIRSWIRSGLIQPVKMVRRLCYFDFEQVAGAKALSELRRSGVSAQRIHSSLEQLKRWLPGAQKALSHLSVEEKSRRLVLRLKDGRTADISGQLHLEFEPPLEEVVDEQHEGAAHRAVDREENAAEQCFEAAACLEEAGDLEQAQLAYHRGLLLGGPDPEGAFNLGNVLYLQGRKDAAAQRYFQAVELDPEYVEAWNRLGKTLAEIERPAQAVAAFQQALRLEPQYADAHFNLGELLHSMGHDKQARDHWTAYLAQDPSSSIARRVQELLAETDDSG